MYVSTHRDQAGNIELGCDVCQAFCVCCLRYLSRHRQVSQAYPESANLSQEGGRCDETWYAVIFATDSHSWGNKTNTGLYSPTEHILALCHGVIRSDHLYILLGKQR